MNRCQNPQEVCVKIFISDNVYSVLKKVPCLTTEPQIHSPAVSQPAQSLSPQTPQPQTATPSAEPEALFTRDFLLVCLSTFLFSGSMFLLFAVLPFFVVQDLHGAESQVGMIMGAFAVSAVLSRPLSGRLVDTWSRKSCLTLGALIYVIFPPSTLRPHQCLS